MSVSGIIKVDEKKNDVKEEIVQKFTWAIN